MSTKFLDLTGLKHFYDTYVKTKLNIAGGTMTGNLILNADPTATLQAATKKYVDASKSSMLGELNNRIATGSYRGTGTAGSDHPNSLTFDFEPKLLIVREDDNATTLIAVSGMSYCGVLSNSTSSVYDNVTWSGNTVSWYHYDGSDGWQLNSNYSTYYYFAIR